LKGTDPIKNIIQNKGRMQEIRDQSARDGMTTLMQDGVRKILLGQTDLLQVRKVCMR